MDMLPFENHFWAVCEWKKRHPRTPAENKYPVLSKSVHTQNVRWSPLSTNASARQKRHRHGTSTPRIQMVHEKTLISHSALLQTSQTLTRVVITHQKPTYYLMRLLAVAKSNYKFPATHKL